MVQHNTRRQEAAEEGGSCRVAAALVCYSPMRETDLEPPRRERREGEKKKMKDLLAEVGRGYRLIRNVTVGG